MLGAKEAQPMPDGILIIDKPTGWTSMDVCLPTRSMTARGPSDFQILGGNEFRLRQGSALRRNA